MSAWTTPSDASTGVERCRCASPRPVGSGPGSAVRKRIASGCVKRGSATLVGNVLAERLPQRDVDEVDADRVAHEVGHLPAGNPRRDLDDGDAAVREAMSCGKAIAVAQAERAHGVGGDALGDARAGRA